MKILAFKNTGRTEFDDKHNTSIVGRRWILTVDRFDLAFQVGFAHQCNYKDFGWSYGNGYYDAGIELSLKQWGLGHTMRYYDGENHIIKFGPFYMSWLR